MSALPLGHEVLRALAQVWTSLQPLGLPMAIMGGLALSFWRRVRSTRDVDLLIELAAADLDGVLERLRQAGIRPRHEPPVLALGPMRIVQLMCQLPGSFLEIRIDLLLAESDYQKQALGRRVTGQLPGLDVEIQVLSCEDLILHKLLAGRIIDRADVSALLRFNRTTLELPYLLGWVTRLGLIRDFSEVWREAFPGETPPVPA